MIKAKQLHSGDLITTVSLSSGMAGEPEFLPRYDYGVSRVKTVLELQVTASPHSLKGSAFVYTHPELRALDLMDAFRDPTIKGIFSNIGGDEAIRLLPYIDFEVIRNNPKIVIGYSDTSVIHWMCYKAGLVSFYGPSILCEFAENGAMHGYTLKYLKKALFEHAPMGLVEPCTEWTNEYLEWSNPENFTIQRKMKPNSGYEVLQGVGVHSGVLLGGCIEVLEFMKETILWPDLEEWKGKLLFLETSEDKPTPTQVLYMLRNYGASGILGAINGILVAKPQDEVYYEEYKEVLLRVVRDEFGFDELPIFYNMSFGHNAPMCILPLGVRAEIDCDSGTFSITESALEVE